MLGLFQVQLITYVLLEESQEFFDKIWSQNVHFKVLSQSPEIFKPFEQNKFKTKDLLTPPSTQLGLQDF